MGVEVPVPYAERRETVSPDETTNGDTKVIGSVHPFRLRWRLSEGNHVLRRTLRLISIGLGFE